MSAILILTPIISTAWAAFNSAVFGAATALGFSEVTNPSDSSVEKKESVKLDIKNSHIITDTLEKEEKVSFKKEGVTVTFKKDIRGHCGISVSGEGKTREQLRSIGNEVCHRVIQEYVRNTIKSTLKKKGFELVEEEVAENKTIRLTVRRWR